MAPPLPCRHSVALGARGALAPARLRCAAPGRAAPGRAVPRTSCLASRGDGSTYGRDNNGRAPRPRLEDDRYASYDRPRDEWGRDDAFFAPRKGGSRRKEEEGARPGREQARRGLYALTRLQEEENWEREQERAEAARRQDAQRKLQRIKTDVQSPEKQKDKLRRHNYLSERARRYQGWREENEAATEDAEIRRLQKRFQEAREDRERERDRGRRRWREYDSYQEGELRRRMGGYDTWASSPSEGGPGRGAVGWEDASPGVRRGASSPTGSRGRQPPPREAYGARAQHPAGARPASAPPWLDDSWGLPDSAPGPARGSAAAPAAAGAVEGAGSPVEPLARAWQGRAPGYPSAPPEGRYPPPRARSPPPLSERPPPPGRFDDRGYTRDPREDPSYGRGYARDPREDPSYGRGYARDPREDPSYGQGYARDPREDRYAAYGAGGEGRNLPPPRRRRGGGVMGALTRVRDGIGGWLDGDDDDALSGGGDRYSGDRYWGDGYYDSPGRGPPPPPREQW